MQQTDRDECEKCGKKQHKKHQEEKQKSFYICGVLTHICKKFLEIKNHEGMVCQIPYQDIKKVTFDKHHCHCHQHQEDCCCDIFYDECCSEHHEEMKCWSKYECFDEKKHAPGESISHFVFIEGKWRRKKQPKKHDDHTVHEELCKLIGCHVKVYIKKEDC